MNKMNEVKFGFVGGNTTALDSLKVKFGKSLTTDQTITVVEALQLAILPDKRLHIYKDGEEVAKTSEIVQSFWQEDVNVSNVLSEREEIPTIQQFALAKCFETKSGSKYYFVPVEML